MPHTSRRRPPPRPRRQRQQTDDGWTTITTTSSRPGPRRSIAHESPIRPAELPPGATLDSLRLEYARQETVWQASTCHATLRLELARLRPVSLKSCVCLGLGSLAGRRHSLLQLAALLTCLDVLGDFAAASAGLRDEPCPLYAQDPAFNALDEALLASFGISVVPDPDAFGLMDASTFLYAPHCERSFLYPAVDGKEPALAICNGFASAVSGPMSAFVSAREVDIARSFLQKRTASAFPSLEEAEGTFNDLVIYGRAHEE
ncbi:MAG: hypothetical protein M1832_000481 [Thelocarpon impressellum]|nr:MAG: hypothetical protein M1832_000481 [Thelocarpon impressellum]